MIGPHLFLSSKKFFYNFSPFCKIFLKIEIFRAEVGTEDVPKNCLNKHYRISSVSNFIKNFFTIFVLLKDFFLEMEIFRTEVAVEDVAKTRLNFHKSIFSPKVKNQDPIRFQVQKKLKINTA